MEEGSEQHFNYFNYFTEVEEHFQRARGTGIFLFSPIDWALIETWKDAGVPLEAVHRGIDVAFEKWQTKKRKYQQVNSLAYCAQAVMTEARMMSDSGTAVKREVQAPFTLDELQGHLAKVQAALDGKPAFAEIGQSLNDLAENAAKHFGDLEQLEQRLTTLEEKMGAAARLALSDEQLFAAREEFESSIRPYRSKMSAEQISILERQYIERRLFEILKLPRLSLFYLY